MTSIVHFEVSIKHVNQENGLKVNFLTFIWVKRIYIIKVDNLSFLLKKRGGLCVIIVHFLPR